MVPMLLTGLSSNAQCASAQNVTAFDFNGKTYEIIKENKTWTAAAACAVSRGGYLAEINSAEENEAIFNQLLAEGIDPDDTDAPDGYSSYVWLGGNDISSEGNWIWNGDNNTVATPFWLGTASGAAVEGRYNNWGNEPDNSASGTGQDGLGLAIINWPLGVAGQWNDIKHGNTLYFVVEYDALMHVKDTVLKSSVTLYPNPAGNTITIISANSGIEKVTIFNTAGQQVIAVPKTGLSNGEINIVALPAGIYMVSVVFIDGTFITKKLVRE